MCVCVWGGGGGGGVRGWSGGKVVGIRPKKTTTIYIHLVCVLMPYIKFQVPSSSGSLVLT